MNLPEEIEAKLIEHMAVAVFGKYMIEERIVQMQAALAVAYPAIRDAVLEEAASTADEFGYATDISDAIRAMKTEGGE